MRSASGSFSDRPVAGMPVPIGGKTGRAAEKRHVAVNPTIESRHMPPEEGMLADRVMRGAIESAAHPALVTRTDSEAAVRRLDLPGATDLAAVLRDVLVHYRANDPNTSFTQAATDSANKVFFIRHNDRVFVIKANVAHNAVYSLASEKFTADSYRALGAIAPEAMVARSDSDVREEIDALRIMCQTRDTDRPQLQALSGEKLSDSVTETLKRTRELISFNPTSQIAKEVTKKSEAELKSATFAQLQSWFDAGLKDLTADQRAAIVLRTARAQEVKELEAVDLSKGVLVMSYVRGDNLNGIAKNPKLLKSFAANGLAHLQEIGQIAAVDMLHSNQDRVSMSRRNSRGVVSTPGEGNSNNIMFFTHRGEVGPMAAIDQDMFEGNVLTWDGKVIPNIDEYLHEQHEGFLWQLSGVTTGTRTAAEIFDGLPEPIRELFSDPAPAIAAIQTGLVIGLRNCREHGGEAFAHTREAIRRNDIGLSASDVALLEKQYESLSRRVDVLRATALPEVSAP